MSRLEEALEKALKIRQQTGEQASGSEAGTVSAAGRPSKPHFEIRQPIIDAKQLDYHIVTLKAPKSVAAEQYRKLRARILSATREHFKNTIMVVSSDLGEGKTTTSVNLAISLAQELDHTVLLVDADLRKPAACRMLGIHASQGLSEYLEGKASLQDVLVHTGVGKLVVLPAGRPPSNPAELLASNRMSELVHELKVRYADRYIIFDTSPLLLTSDAIPIAKYIDGVVLVIQAERTSAFVAQKTIALLGNVPVLGVVFNNVPEYLMSSHYPYYTYSYELLPEPQRSASSQRNE